VNELYIDATECIEDGDVELARLKAEAALALAPEHPFVKDMLEHLEK